MKAHILIVDDEKEFRFSAEIALRKAGYRANSAAGGKEALGKIVRSHERSDPFHLVVLDIGATLSGTELIEELGRRGIGIPVFAMTACGEKACARELRRMGCFDFIEKPFPPNELVGRIADTLSRLSIGGLCKPPSE